MPSVYMASFSSMVNIERPAGHQVKWFRGVGWCQARRRTHACEQAIEWGAKRIVQLDADQVYEADVLERLVARQDEGYRVVAAMVPGRGYVERSGVRPFQRLAWRTAADGRSAEPITPEDGEIVEARFPTSACSILYAEDLVRLSRPWFFNTYKPEDWSIVHGEDGTFFWRMEKELGVTSYVDTTIRVKHAHVFEIDETFPDRFADWSEVGRGDPAICRYENGGES